MALSKSVYNSANGNGPYSIGFSYIDPSHVKVYVNGSLVSSANYSIANGQITFSSGAPSSQQLIIQRETPGRTDATKNYRAVDFVNGSTINEADLDNSFLQVFYMAQEGLDTGNGALPYNSATDTFDAGYSGNKKITNVGTPTASTDAATKGYVDSTSSNASNLTSGTVSASRLPASGVSAGVYGDGLTPLTQVTVDSTGRVTAASERAITSSDLPAHTHTASEITNFNTTVDGRIDTKIAANALALENGFAGPNWDAESKRITNVAPPVSGTDAVNLNAISNLALYGNAAAAVPQYWNLTTGSWTQVSGSGANTIWEQTLTLDPPAVGTDPNLFVVSLGGVVQFPTTAYRLPAPSQITISATQATAPSSGVALQVRNFGVSRVITSNATASSPGVVTVGSNIDVDSGGVISVKTASATDKGVVKVGTGLSIDGTGTLNATVIGNATTSTKGIMQVGTGLQVSSGTVSVDPASPITSATFTNTGLKVLDTDASHSLSIVPGSNLTADRTLTVTTGDTNRTATLNGDLTVNAGGATVSGTNTGDQTITLSGAVTGSGTGAISTALVNGVVGTAALADSGVTLAKLANVATSTVLGRSTAGTGVVEALSLANFALTAGGSSAAFSNPPTCSTAAASYTDAGQLTNKAYVDSKVDSRISLITYPTATSASGTTYNISLGDLVVGKINILVFSVAWGGSYVRANLSYAASQSCFTFSGNNSATSSDTFTPLTFNGLSAGSSQIMSMSAVNIGTQIRYGWAVIVRTS